MSFSLKKIKLDLKVNWKISRNEFLFKENYILERNGYESEIAANIRYGENPERIEAEFLDLSNTNNYNPLWCNSFKNAYNNVVLKEKAEGDIYNFLKIEQMPRVLTSYSIPMMDLDDVGEYIEQNAGFESYKLKIANLSDLVLLEEVCQHTNKKIRIDANEGFKSLDNYLEFEKRMSHYNIEFIEQPFSSLMIKEYQALKPISKFEIIADESVESDFDIELFQSKFHGINVKLMKAGGIENGKYLLEKAKQAGFKTMIGCMIESSLGISEAYALASLCDYCDLDGALLTTNDPFKDLLNCEGSYLSLR